MARESQGLQVLLIVFVMLSVVLGVVLYVYVKKADEATKAAVAADSAQKQAQQATDAAQKERDTLKRLIGYPDRNTEDIEKQFAEDMQTYGNERNDSDKAVAEKPLFAEGTLFYSRLLAGMNKVLQDRTAELITSRSEMADLEARFKSREMAKDEAIAALSAGYGKLDEQVKKITGEVNSELQASSAQTNAFTQQVQTIKKNADLTVAAASQERTNAQKAIEDKEKDVRRLADIVRKTDREQMDIPSGEITWVSLPNKMVWVNRGRADALQRLTEFTVYSAESNDFAKAVKKGRIEVTSIDGDHSARARILDDKLADPILAGDKIFTPLWSPGQLNHFALTGIMNLDGDGRNQLSVVRGLITQKGGEVDAWLDEQGHKQGRITADTRYIVIGDAPSSPDSVKNHTALINDADRYQVHKMTLTDFKQQVDYKKSSSIEHFNNAGASGDVGQAAQATKAAKAAKAAPKSTDSGN